MKKAFNPILNKLKPLGFAESLKILKSRNDWIVQEAPATPWYWWLSGFAWIHGLATEKYSPGWFFTYCTKEVGTLVVSKKTFMRLAERIITKEIKGEQIMEKWIKRWRPLDRKLNGLVLKIKKTNLKLLKEKELLKLFENFCKIYYEAEVLPLSNEFIIPYTDLFLKRVVAKNPANGQIISKMITPGKKSFMQKEEDELLAIKKLLSAHRQKALKRHLEKWYFMDGGYDGPHPTTLKRLKKRLAGLQKKPLVGKNSKNIFLDNKTKAIVAVTKLSAGWKDERKKNNLIGSWVLDKFAREFSTRYKIPFKLLQYASPRDLPDVIKRSDKFIGELKKRLTNGSVWGINGTKYFGVITGEKFKKIQKIIGQLKKAKNSLEGTIVNPGKISGTVQIIHNPAKEKFKPGGILVTSMTRPEFVPLMKQAKAVLCDEGGVLSHAAIVSRELNIPCIVGLGHAMVSLKNGDLVEVNADEGVVKKL